MANAAFPATAPDGDAIGIESEWFAVGAGRQGTHRLRLGTPDDPDSVAALLDRTRRVDGVSLQTEPGAQVEAATAPRATVAESLRLLADAGAALAESASQRGAVLLAAGIDLWHDHIPPQQATEPRYPAMATYLASRDRAGAVMMRHTASLQLNLDMGRGDVAGERWATALLAAPVSLATFAASPALDGSLTSRRAMNWASVDPTRTGIPQAFVEHPTWTPSRQLADAAMNADVLLVRHAGGSATPGQAGWTFADWIANGHETHGWPTVDDLRYHLTTLFHEVRPRGWLELRSLDAVPARWREVAVVLHAGLLLDTRARQRVLEVLEPTRRRLPELLARAARVGVADPALCALAVEVWSFALDGAKRLGPSVPSEALRHAEQFIDRFTLRGRSPADDIREALRRSPAAAIELVAEPSQPARVPA